MEVQEDRCDKVLALLADKGHKSNEVMGLYAGPDGLVSLASKGCFRP